MIEDHKQFLNTRDRKRDYSKSILEDISNPDKGWGISTTFIKTNKDLNLKDKFLVDELEVVNKLGQTFKRSAFNTEVSGSVYSASAKDFLIAVTNLSYAPSIGLPHPSSVLPGKNYIVKDEAGGAASTTITITSEGEKLIDGAANKTITSNYGIVEFYTDAANWFTKTPAAASPGVSSASGSYTGDGGTNTAIPHGLGAVPKLVEIIDSTTPITGEFKIMGNNPTMLRKEQAAAITVTAMDGTNFYVSSSANTNLSVYYWVAIT